MIQSWVGPAPAFRSFRLPPCGFGGVLGDGAIETLPLFAINATRGVMLARRVRHDALPARRNALAGEKSLPDGDGVYLAPLRWVHTFGMTFSIDAVFLDPEGRVLTLYHDLPPDRVSMPAFRAKGVLKLPAGTLRSTETRVGDMVQFLGN